MKPGDKYGRWTVIGPPPSTARTRVRCRCDCGTEREVIADALRRGLSQSCGCLRSEVARSARRDPAERFWEKVNKDGPIPEVKPELGPCWIWTDSLDEKGYGRFNDGERPRKAHDFSYELHFDKMPTGLEPDHLCRNRPCVRPAHLEAVTHRVNSQRAAYAQDECSRGHKLPEPSANGRRVCRPCANRRSREYKERQRVLAMRVYDAVMGGKP
jgi:HNH endonuclease